MSTFDDARAALSAVERYNTDEAVIDAVAALRSLIAPPTEAQVEAAARIFYESQTGHDGLATSTYREAWLGMARRALEAAREV